MVVLSTVSDCALAKGAKTAAAARAATRRLGAIVGELVMGWRREKRSKMRKRQEGERKTNRVETNYKKNAKNSKQTLRQKARATSGQMRDLKNEKRGKGGEERRRRDGRRRSFLKRFSGFLPRELGWATYMSNPRGNGERGKGLRKRSNKNRKRVKSHQKSHKD